MKKLIFILFAFIGFTASAQYTTPRARTGVSNNASLNNFNYLNKTDAAGADSVALATNAYFTTYRLVLVDSFTLKQPVVTNCYAGDKIQIVISAASGTPKLKFTGSNWLTGGTATMTTNLRGTIDLVFDGAKWVETSRYIF